MTTKEDILSKCTVDGNIVKLPEDQLERKLYLEVAKSLNLIGGKWKGGKVQGFVFLTDPTELLSEIANGGDRNLKKEFQFLEPCTTNVDSNSFLTISQDSLVAPTDILYKFSPLTSLGISPALTSATQGNL
jgi:hypothetical protein